MQEFFTQAAIAVELFGFGYMASSFAFYTRRRMNQSARWVPAQASTPVPPVARKVTPPKGKLPSVEQLRQECQKAGIKWRHAHGKNRHLKKAEMIEALKRLEQLRRVVAQQPKSAKMTPRKVA